MAESLKMQAILFEELVWTVRVDAQAGTLAVQLRDRERRSAGYHLVRLEDGRWGPRIDLENGWWTELQAVKGDCLAIGRYGDPAMPVISETMVVDGWKAKILEADALPVMQEDVNMMLPSVSLQGVDNLDPRLLPGSYLQSIAIQDCLVQAWHALGQGGTELWLEVWHLQTLIYRTCLEQCMEKLNPSPFFVVGNWLVTIRNRQELCWMKLVS